MNAKLLPYLESELSGWGRYPLVNSRLQRPEKIDSLKEIVKTLKDNSVLARGAGRSYGDAGLNSQGYTILTERCNRMLGFDEETGVLLCEAGVTISELLTVFVPRGWFPAITPGTKYVTVGGAVAFDVHGKNHHWDGAFSNCVVSLKLLKADGQIVKLSRTENSDLFWATVGGMGLTGIITEVELTLRPIKTAYIEAHSIKASNLDEAIALFDEYEAQYQYSVAWIDCLASGDKLGRSILTFGNFASEINKPDPLQLKPKGRFRVRFDAPSGLLNRYSMGLFNNLYYGGQLAKQAHSIVDYDRFFYPLDFVSDWNRLYGKAGFVQYQCVLPPEVSREGLVKILSLCSQSGWGSFLAVLKRFGAGQGGYLSFPMPGYTLALDMPVKSGLWEFLDRLDVVVRELGGRVYLAKDARLSPETFRAMYPDYPKWLEVKSRVDPNNIFRSALSERLQICFHER